MLTDTQVRGAKPSDRPQKLTDARGLYLLVTPDAGFRRQHPRGGAPAGLTLTQ
jgi:hypothetical protein